MSGFPVDVCCVKCHEASLPVDQTPMQRMMSRPFIMCSTCGNKRCPKATDHELACTNSNESGQAGSRYAFREPRVHVRELALADILSLPAFREVLDEPSDGEEVQAEDDPTDGEEVVILPPSGYDRTGLSNLIAVYCMGEPPSELGAGDGLRPGWYLFEADTAGNPYKFAHGRALEHDPSLEDLLDYAYSLYADATALPVQACVCKGHKHLGGVGGCYFGGTLIPACPCTWRD